MSLAILRQASVSSLYANLHPSSGYEIMAPESHNSMLRLSVLVVIVKIVLVGFRMFEQKDVR